MKSPVNAGLCTLTHNITLEIDTNRQYRRLSSAALESGADDWKRSVLLSLSRLCGRVCIILLTRAQFLQNGPLADLKLDHSKRETPADGYAVAPVPRAATPPPRRRAWLRIFLVRCGLPCDPPVGGHSCNGGMIPRFHRAVCTKAV